MPKDKKITHPCFSDDETHPYTCLQFTKEDKHNCSFLWESKKNGWHNCSNGKLCGWYQKYRHGKVINVKKWNEWATEHATDRILKTKQVMSKSVMKRIKAMTESRDRDVDASGLNHGSFHKDIGNVKPARAIRVYLRDVQKSQKPLKLVLGGTMDRDVIIRAAEENAELAMGAYKNKKIPKHYTAGYVPILHDYIVRLLDVAKELQIALSSSADREVGYQKMLEVANRCCEVWEDAEEHRKKYPLRGKNE